MIHSLAGRMASFYVARGECSEKNADIFAYACEAIISTGINFLLALTVSIAFGRPIEGMLFTLIFVVLRKYTGGHHADSHLKCILTFNILLAFALSFLYAHTIFSIGDFYTLLIVSISLVGIFMLAPMSHKNKPLSGAVRASAKIKGRIFVVILLLFCILDVFMIRSDFGFIVSLSVFSVFGSLAYAKIDDFGRKGGKRHENNRTNQHGPKGCKAVS